MYFYFGNCAKYTSILITALLYKCSQEFLYNQLSFYSRFSTKQLFFINPSAVFHSIFVASHSCTYSSFCSKTIFLFFHEALKHLQPFALKHLYQHRLIFLHKCNLCRFYVYRIFLKVHPCFQKNQDIKQ